MAFQLFIHDALVECSPHDADWEGIREAIDKGTEQCIHWGQIFILDSFFGDFANFRNEHITAFLAEAIRPVFRKGKMLQSMMLILTLFIFQYTKIYCKWYANGVYMFWQLKRVIEGEYQ
jgi:hypothetical protein